MAWLEPYTKAIMDSNAKLGQRMTEKIISHYHQHADFYRMQYDLLDAYDVHAAWRSLLLKMKLGCALDVGAGSGRDALWLSKQGWQVTAIEPAEGLRQFGQRKTGLSVEWIDDQLPTLACLDNLCRQFDLILLSAVWMHLAPNQRSLAFSRLKKWLSASGMLIMTIRFGLVDQNRPMFPISVSELQQLALDQGVSVKDLSEGFTQDRLNRNEINWKTYCFQHAEEADR